MALLTPDTASIVAVAAAGGAFVALVVAVVATIRVGRIRRAYHQMLGDADEGHVIDVVGAHVEAVDGLRRDVAQTQARVQSLATDLADAVRHVAVVRYDAFGDMGGRLSFSAALLDDGGDGLVVSSINGRSESRSYAKGVKAGGSEHGLSPEEQQAVDFAMGAPVSKRQRSARAPG